ncbi:MAG: DUF4924 family protein [Bacteroidaceae bacterium]|nr:DUF4924 family protein [Bacteroidaceae bacterium]
MLIATRLREANRAEYLLYMWQVEDLIRAYGGDMARLEADYLSRFNVSDEQREAMRRWYADLCEMMRSEGRLQSGHLQINRNTLEGLCELHAALLAREDFPYYRQLYQRTLPALVALRAKGAGSDEPELQTMLTALYGTMLLRMQGKAVSESTAEATRTFSDLLAQLSDYFAKHARGELNLDQPA